MIMKNKIIKKRFQPNTTRPGFGDITLIDHTYLALIRVLFVFCIGLVMVSLVFNAIRELAAAYQRRLVEV